MKRAHRTTSEPSAERHPERAREYDRDVQSVAYFNDAVFAMAMTLLVVSIRVPSGTSAGTLGRALRGLGSSFASYGISFIVVGFDWLGYHRQLRFIERFKGAALVIRPAVLDERCISSLHFPIAEPVLRLCLRDLLRAEHGRNRPPARDALDLPARRRLLRNVEARLNRYYTLRALYPPADLPAIDSGRGAGPQAPEYAWILVFMGRPLLRRVAYR